MKKRLLRIIAVLAVVISLAAGGASAETYQLLQQGNKSGAVLTLQQALASLGYDPGAIDGKYGAYTENAVRHFQRDYGLKVDGLAGAATQKLLYAVAAGQAAATKAPVVTEAPYQTPTRTLRQGATGNDVRTVQLRLQALGYYQQTPTAMYDHDTVTAVTMFQFYNGLTADGVAGTQTFARLFSSAAVKAPSPSAATAAPTQAPTSTAAPTAAPQSTVTVPTRTLRKGSQGNDVLSLQQRLQQLGYAAGTVPGLYDAGTVEGVRAFQRRNGLTADGVAGSKTYAKLYSSSAVPAASAQPTAAPATATPAPTAAYTVPTRTLRRSASGSDVTTVQQRLLELGYAVSVTGFYDDTTVQAVRMFQLYNSLSADGVAGSKTYAKLFAPNAVHAPAAATATPAPTPTATPTAAPTPTPTPAAAWQIPTRTLYSGASGNDVRTVQQRLLQLGYLYEVTGQYNAATMNAVKAFQAANRLTADGIAGSRTYAVLFSDSAVSAAAATPTPTPVVTVQPQPGVTTPAASYPVLSSGSKGDAVTRLQTRLQALGYSVSVTGAYDNATASAVRAFQTNNYLTVDGVAGSDTQTTLYSDAARTASQTPTQSYTTLSVNTSGGSSAVKEMQNRLQALGYPLKVNGTFDGETHNAVVAFQQRNGLVISGIANGTTLSALYSSSAKPYSTSVDTLPADAGKMAAPSNVQLLWWYDDVKVSTKSGQTVLVYDPATSISWNIKLYSLGKHADSQPAAWQDTQLMNRSFGKTSWDCHPVYVCLLDGRWTLAAMHNYPHLYGSVNDNGFGGHLCIHFLRTYEECRAAGDVDYGVQMQDTIRSYWKKLTGETVK